MVALKEQVVRSSDTDRPRLSERIHAVTLFLALWSIVGLFVDGRAHNTDVGLDSFFTPWHGLLYSGFTAVAVWMGRQVLDAKGSGPWRMSAIPVGYGLGLIGVAMVGFGAVTDYGWHEIFGFDSGIKAPFSPPHLVLFTGGLLVVSTPARALWKDRQRGTGFKDVFVPVMSVTLTVALLLFFMHYHSPFYRNVAATKPFAEEVQGLDDAEFTGEPRSMVEWLSDLDDGLYPYDHYTTVAGTSTIIITNLLLMALVLMVVRRYRVSFGIFTAAFALIAVLVSPLGDFKDIPAALALIVGGLAADILVARLRPHGSDRATQFRVLAGLVPFIMWSSYFLIVELAYEGIGWTFTVWSGTILMCSLAGVGMSILMAPTPAGLDVEGEEPLKA